MEHTEYIERKMLLSDELTHCLPHSVGKAAGRVVVFVEDIESIPAADVSPVVHGKWKYRKSWDVLFCSNCSYESFRTRNYCPNCGARMDGE